MSEPVSDSLFNFDFERHDTPVSTGQCRIQSFVDKFNILIMQKKNVELSKQQVQRLMFQEALHFRPMASGINY